MNSDRRAATSFLLPALMLFAVLALVFFKGSEDAVFPEPRWAGVARVDVTPEAPVRLTGYGGRPSPHTGVAQRLWGKALAIGGAGDAPVLWLTLDNCGVTREVWLELRGRITRRTGVAAERIVMTISHTHSAPATTGWAPFIQPESLTDAEHAAIAGYTRELLDKLESVAVAALAHRFPAQLSWSEGRATFAANRRTPGGPVDHALPVLKVAGSDGKVRALVASYACHCTTCTGAVMAVCGDWAGFAQEAMERDWPGALAMIAIGCAGDADPRPRGGTDGGIALARQQGEAVAAEVRRLAGGSFRPLTGKLMARRVEAALPYAPHFTAEQWAQRAQQADINGRHARHWQSQLAGGAVLPASLEYEVTAWHLGDELALLFLPGEVVVDYSLHLKREFDPARLWVNAYSNWVPCYIPSRRILSEGGYEAEGSLWYYGRPGRLAPESEETILRAARAALPGSFRAKQEPGP